MQVSLGTPFPTVFERRWISRLGVSRDPPGLLPLSHDKIIERQLPGPFQFDDVVGLLGMYRVNRMAGANRWIYSRSR